MSTPSSTFLPLLISTVRNQYLSHYYTVRRLMREANADLRDQLHHERTEERRKLVQQSRQDNKGGGVGASRISVRWRAILESSAAAEMSGTRS